MQEAVRNIERHAHATTIQLKLRTATNQLHLVIGDDGIGFTSDDGTRKKGLGLTSIEERIHLLNGRLSIESSRGRGTTLSIRIPLSSTRP
ncbi:MAG: ATP-binding protein [Nibricoccus sp.]